MRKIALQGLMGRKRDTALLWVVVLLAFLFLVLSTILITSLQKTDQAQRLDTYGRWQVMAAGLSVSEANTLASQAHGALVVPLIPASGARIFDGDNEYYLTPYSPELASTASLHLKEGRWPQARNEIVLEYARMTSLGLQVGDTFTVLSHLQLPLTEDGYAAQKVKIDVMIESAREHLLEQFPVTDHNFDMFWHYTYVMDQIDRLGLGEDFLGRSYDSLTPEEQETAYTSYLDSDYGYNSLRPNDTKIPGLLGHEELLLRATQNTSALVPLDLAMQYKYTVCGVAETYSDRWDSGNVALPTGFVTWDNYELLSSGPAVTVETYTTYSPVSFDALVLLSDETHSAREIWKDNLPAFNSLLRSRIDFTTPCWLQVQTDSGWVNIMEFSRFCMADPDYPTSTSLLAAQGYLLPQNPNGSSLPWTADPSIFQSDAILDVYATTGTLEQLIEVQENVVTFRDTTASGFTQEQTDSLDLDGASVLIYGDEQVHEIPLEAFRTGNFTINGLVPMPEQFVLADGMDSPDDTVLYRLNRFSYPQASEGGGQMLMLVMGILFVTTVCAVFQIFFTQLRRRMQRIVRMKAIGAENRQIAGLLGWEFLYFWLTAMPIGALLGTGGAWAAAEVLSRTQARHILLTIDLQIFLLSLAAGTLALLLGMLVPMVMAVGMPLTGRTTRKKPLPPPRRETRQDFFHVSLRGLWDRKGKTIGSAVLCVFMMSIAILCFFLGFRFLVPYRESVQRDGKPDYLLQSPYAMSDRQLEKYLTALEELDVCAKIAPYRVGNGVDLYADTLASSPLAQAVGQPISTRVCSLDAQSSLFAQYNQAATVGQLDPEAFEQGEQALLLIPLYQTGGRVNEEALAAAEGWARIPASGIRTSYYAEYDGIYDRDTALSVGDKLLLRGYTTVVTETGKSLIANEAEVTVGAILYYFPDTGLWPVSGSREGYQLFCAPGVIGKLLPYAIRTYDSSSVEAIRGTTGVFYDNDYGLTDFYLRARDGLSLEEADTALLVFARRHNMDLEIYHESSEKLLQDAINNILLVCLLGLTAVLLALVIFADTVASDIEQERRHIGILQALGVSHRRFLLRQLCIGLTVSTLAVLLSNLLLWSVVGVSAAISGAVLSNLLWHYPIRAHCLICLVMAILLTALYLAPMVRLRKHLPIENIKSRK